ncbi:hypothetical protein [Vibrio phage RYC]|nr:hypothetical protein [Vibrio phage RYC]
MIQKQDNLDTMAIIKLTEWESEEVLPLLKQHSVKDNSWFIREVRIGKPLYNLIEGLVETGKIKVELVRTYHFNNERPRFLR